MKIKVLSLSILSLLILCGFVSQALSQTVDCNATLEAWRRDKSLENFMKTHSCTCPSLNSRPVCTPTSSVSSGSSRLNPQQQMQLQMMQGILQPLFNSIFDFSDLFAPPGPSRQEIERQKQQQLQEEIRRQQEAKARQEALNRWLQVQAEAERERAAEEARKRAEGQNILSRSSISGSGGLTPFSWSSPQTSLTPVSLKGYETKNFSPTEQLLCSAYFSKLAEGAMQSGDLEGARFYASLMDDVIQGQPTSIECKPPKEIASSINTRNALESKKKYTQMANLYNEVTPKIEKLSEVQVKLDEVVKKKEESKKKIEEVEKQVEDLKAKAQTEEKPEKKAETDDLLAKALELKAEAEKEHQEAVAQEQKLAQEKECLQKEIESVKAKYQDQEEGQR